LGCLRFRHLTLILFYFFVISFLETRKQKTVCDLIFSLRCSWHIVPIYTASYTRRVKIFGCILLDLIWFSFISLFFLSFTSFRFIFEPYPSLNFDLGLWNYHTVRVYLYICVSVYLCICISVYLYVCVSVCLCICISVYLYICLSVYLCICMSVYLYISHWILSTNVEFATIDLKVAALAAT
jgi:hypothetical protein